MPLPYTPLSPPFVERLIGTLRREYLDHLFFWNAYDLQKKLDRYKEYYNTHRAHRSLEANTPQKLGIGIKKVMAIKNYQWKKYCHGLFHLPLAA